MEKALEPFNHWIKNSSFTSIYETLQSKKFPITLATQVKSDLLYLSRNTLRELIEKESIEVQKFYQDINCTQLIELKEPLIVSQKDLNITKAAHSRLVANHLIYSFENSRQAENYIDEWTLKIFFSRESCTDEKAAYILVGVGPVIPTRVISKYDCTKFMFAFYELEERIVRIISSGYYDEMDIPSLIDETLELSGDVLEKKKIYQIANFVILFNSWLVRHPLYMADKFCKMGISHKNFSAHEQLIIKALNDRKNTYPELFKTEFPHLHNFLEKNKEPQEITTSPIEQYLSKVGEKGGKKLKDKKELRLLVKYEIKKDRTWTTFKAMLEKKHTQEISAYDGIEGACCYSIYLIDDVMYYSTDTQEEEQKTSIYTLKRFFSEEKGKIKESSELVSPT